MEYGRIKRSVLELINQYSIAGEQVALSYNNQADYVRRIPNLINQAVTDIRMTAKPKRSLRSINRPDDANGWRDYPLPDDFRQIISGGVRRLNDDGQPVPDNHYQILGNHRIWLPPGNWLIEYEAFPEQLPENPADDYPFDEEADVLQAAFYYAAAMLVGQESEFEYSIFNHEYVDRKAEMIPRQTAEFTPIDDVYTGGGWI